MSPARSDIARAERIGREMGNAHADLRMAIAELERLDSLAGELVDIVERARERMVLATDRFAHAAREAAALLAERAEARADGALL